MSRRSWPRIGCIVGLVFDFQAAEDGDASDDELFGGRVRWGMAGLVAIAAKNSHAVDHNIPGARNTNLSAAENHSRLNHGLVAVYFGLREIDFAAAEDRRHFTGLEIPRADLMFAAAKYARARDVRTVGIELLSGFKRLRLPLIEPCLASLAECLNHQKDADGDYKHRPER